MASYNMSKEIKELATLKGMTEEAVAKSFGLTYTWDQWTAWNRGEQYKVTSALADARDAKKAAENKAAFEKKLSEGAAVWRKVGGDWLVQVTGREVAVGDLIEVERRSGEKSKQTVKHVVSRGADGIYCRV